MNDIANKALVLKLNKLWKPVGIGLVSKTICDLMTGVVLAMDINYKVNPDGTPNIDEIDYVNPVEWDEWIKLPIRPWELGIHSVHMNIRVPTVVITPRYSKVPERTFRKKPTKEGLYIRDNGIDGYTGKELELHNSTIDHVIPKNRGGKDTYDNTVLTTREINNKKGNKLNSEAGLQLVVNPHMPKPVKISHTIRKARHRDWAVFLVKK